MHLKCQLQGYEQRGGGGLWVFLFGQGVFGTTTHTAGVVDLLLLSCESCCCTAVLQFWRYTACVCLGRCFNMTSWEVCQVCQGLECCVCCCGCVDAVGSMYSSCAKTLYSATPGNRLGAGQTAPLLVPLGGVGLACGARV